MTAVSTFVTLLTGGGLALVGALTGAVITQVSTAAIARENRREARRMALKTFQRDTLIALQDSAITLLESEFQDVIRSAARPDPPLVARAALAERRSFRDKKAAFQVTSSQVLLLASRVRDDELRERVTSLLTAMGEAVDAAIERGDDDVEAGLVGRIWGEQVQILQRAGHLIRTLDELDDPDVDQAVLGARGGAA
jgi:hypothetical protein